MPEATSNVEFANKISEEGHHHSATHNHPQWIEILEAVLLAIVAVATAWSGYQASRWDARSAQNYNLASRTTVASQEQATLAGQDRLYDIVTFNGWIAAHAAGNDKLTELYRRRFRPEYAAAFEAWEKLDPFNNPSAPAGPIYMVEYVNANNLASEKLSKEAKEYYEMGVSSRETGDKYVKITVFLATVLLLTALSQRFALLGARITLAVIAFLLLISSTYWILTLPRA